ncbi:Phospholipase D zeta 1, partial [Linum perenne]
VPHSCFSTRKSKNSAPGLLRASVILIDLAHLLLPGNYLMMVVRLNGLSMAGQLLKLLLQQSRMLNRRLDALLEAKAKQGVQRNKAPYEEAIPLLMPQQHMVIPHYMGNSSPVEIKSKNADGSVRIPMQDPSSRSSFQDIPLFLPQEPEELDGSSGGPKSNGVESTTSRASNSLRKAKVAPLAPEMPMKSFVDDHDSSDLRGKISRDWTQPSIRPSDLEWWETQERGDQIGSGDETGEVGPQAFCQCQVYA